MHAAVTWNSGAEINTKKVYTFPLDITLKGQATHLVYLDIFIQRIMDEMKEHWVELIVFIGYICLYVYDDYDVKTTAQLAGGQGWARLRDPGGCHQPRTGGWPVDCVLAPPRNMQTLGAL